MGKEYVYANASKGAAEFLGRLDKKQNAFIPFIGLGTIRGMSLNRDPDDTAAEIVFNAADLNIEVLEKTTEQVQVEFLRQENNFELLVMNKSILFGTKK